MNAENISQTENHKEEPNNNIALEVHSPNEDIQININNVPDFCPICFEKTNEDSLPVSTKCYHGFCLECYTSFLEHKMQTFEVINIPCPQDGCKEILTDDIIKAILGQDKYNRYQELVLKKLSHKNLNVKYCPKNACFLPFTPKKEESFTICSCGTKICNICSNFYHQGKPCIAVVDQEFEIYAKENEIKFCIVCKTAVNRVEGCLHMTCCVCDYEWCWNCGKQYDPKHRCKGVWDPSVPSMKQQDKTAWEKFRRLIVLILWGIFYLTIFPLSVLLVLLFFWPYFIMEGGARRRRRRKVSNLCCKLFWSFIISLLTLPLTLLCIVLYVVVMFCYGLYMVITVKPILTRIRRYRRRNHQKKTPRWMEQENHFAYTDAGRPNIVEEQPQPNPVNIFERILRERMQIINEDREEDEETNSMNPKPVITRSHSWPLPVIDIKVQKNNSMPNLYSENEGLNFISSEESSDDPEQIQLTSTVVDLENVMSLSQMIYFNEGKSSNVEVDPLPFKSFTQAEKSFYQVRDLILYGEKHTESEEEDLDLERGLNEAYNDVPVIKLGEKSSDNEENIDLEKGLNEPYKNLPIIELGEVL